MLFGHRTSRSLSCAELTRWANPAPWRDHAPPPCDDSFGPPKVEAARRRQWPKAGPLPARALPGLSFAGVLPNLGVRGRQRARHGSTTELAMAGRFGLWLGRRYLLNKMTLRELIVAYFTHHSILTYLVLIAGSIWLAVTHATGWGPLGAAAV